MLKSFAANASYQSKGPANNSRGDAEVKLSDVVNVNELQRHAPHLFGVLSLSWLLHDAFLGVFMTYGNPVSWRDQVLQDFLVQGRELVPQQLCIDTLIQSSRRDVTDKRDHIYALLAHPLLLIDGKTIVQADYERHVDDVYLDVTAQVLRCVDITMTLSLVGSMGARKQRDLDSDQPSWVIRWDLGKLYSLTIGRLGKITSSSIPSKSSRETNDANPEQWYSAGGKEISPNMKIDTTTKTLRLPAIIFEEILWTSDTMPESELQIDQVSLSPSNRVAMEWVWKSLPDEPCRYTGKYGSRDAFTLSLVSGSYKHRYEAQKDMPRHRRLANAYLDYIKSFYGHGEPNEELMSDAREFENDLALLARERRIVVTKKGFYGLGPQLVRKGDVVAVFPGLRVPYVLRSVRGGYKLVGAAYVHGVMRGEVLDEDDPLDLKAGKPVEIVIV